MIKDYMENEYENMVKLITDSSFEKIILPGNRDEKDIDMSSLLANPKYREYTENCANGEERKQEKY
jgi:hypothetical protein